MKREIHKPIQHTNQSTSEERRGTYSFIALLLGISLLIIGFGVYCITLAPEDWPATILIFVIALMFVFFAFVFYSGLKYEEEYEKRFELNEEGIFVQYIYHKAGTEEKVAIPFESIHSVVVGNNANYVSMPMGKGISFYRFGALMVIKHRNGIYLRQFFEEKEFHDWILRLQDKDCPLFKTEYDLGPALTAGAEYEVDFSKLKGVPWQGTSSYPPFRDEKISNPFLPWEHGAKKREGIEENKQIATKKWEKRIFWLLFGYSLILGGIIMPMYPLDEDGILDIDTTFIFSALLIYILVPFLFVFWRSYTKWYLPFLYFIIAVAGNSFAVFFVSLFIDIPSLYLSIIAINIFVLLFGWIPSFLLIKVAKVLFAFLYKVRRNG